MYIAPREARPGLATFLALFLFMATAMGDWTYSYCSSQNTGSDFPTFTWTWQSNGKCTEHCAAAGTFAFAVIQYKECWCSNYIPQEQDDVGDCTGTCPGFDEEKCGNQGQKYIYVKMDGNSPSGTAGASKPSSTDVSSSSSEAPSTSPPPEATTKPSSKPSSTLQTSTSTSDERPTEAPQTSVVTITEGNNVVTKTQIYSPTSTPEPASNGKSSTNTGAIVGGVVGGVGLLAAIVAGVLFLLWRRRKQQRTEKEGDEAGEPGVQRYASTMSKAGLLRTEREPQYPPPIATSFNKRHSRTLDQDSISPISASDRRNSSFRGVDQRLNPSTIFVFDNSSRGSVGSLDDSRDYHRTLNVRNPDAQ